MRHSSSKGLTLLEILLVIAILAIVAGAFSLLLVSSWRTQQLRDTAITVSTELGRSRTAAMKSGQSQTVVWTERSFSAGVGRSVTLPDSVTLSPAFVDGVRGRRALPRPNGQCRISKRCPRLCVCAGKRQWWWRPSGYWEKR